MTDIWVLSEPTLRSIRAGVYPQLSEGQVILFQGFECEDVVLEGELELVLGCCFGEAL